MLHCANSLCQAPNPEGHKFCHKCRTPLMRHYLWAVGSQAMAYSPGELLGDRYLCKGSRIFLDTKPGLPCLSVTDAPEAFLPYLRLVPWKLHIPQVYDWFQLGAAPEAMLVLLDQAPLDEQLPPEMAQETEDEVTVQLMPRLLDQWPAATPLRQLHWLWQIAHLWHPLSSEQVAGSVLQPELLRVEDSLIRVLELQIEPSNTTTVPLAALATVWEHWSATAQPEIQAFLRQVCQELAKGNIHNTEVLIERLDAAITHLSQAQTHHIEIATYSDQGPTRQRNEDACFPASGTQQQLSEADAPLVIVCDGIGGHQGGDVASHLAIETLEKRVKALTPNQLDPISLTIELEKAVCAANDQISQQNDSEQRYDRQRMGTTVVMGLIRFPELYITHVGDSRAYRITHRGCHQVTLDDDVASRDVRLGYSAYQQALQQPGAGSLVQALGMGTSSLLYPTVQRFVLDEDCVFLLCSDGLSDNDRVEEYWQTEILPLLKGQTDIATVCQRLIQIGNTQNGYDNVTVGLIHCRVIAKAPVPTLAAEEAIGHSAAQTAVVSPTIVARRGDRSSSSMAATYEEEAPTLATMRTQLPPSESSLAKLIRLLLGILVLSGVAGLLVYGVFFAKGKQTPDPELAAPPPSPITTLPTDRPTPIATLKTTSFLQVVALPSPPANLLILQTSPDAGQDPVGGTPTRPSPITTPPNGQLSIGSVLYVLNERAGTSKERWIQVQVCTTPVGNSPETSSPETSSPSPLSGTPNAPSEAASPPAATPFLQGNGNLSPILLKPGQTGWIREADLQPFVTPLTPTPDQQGSCTNSPSP